VYLERAEQIAGEGFGS